MGWMQFILGVLALFSINIINLIVFFRQKKQSEDIKVSDQEVELSKKSLLVLNKSFDTISRISDLKGDQIEELVGITKGLKRDLAECKIKITEQRRQIRGMQEEQRRDKATIEELENRDAGAESRIAELESALSKIKEQRDESDSLVCFIEDCPNREPDIGTYSSESA